MTLNLFFLALLRKRILYLNELIPAGRHDNRSAGVRRETNARDPLAVAVLGNVKLAVAQGVPDLDVLVARSRHNLTVVWGEGYREHVIGVTDKALSGLTSVQVPKTNSLVPRSRQSKVTIGRNSNVLNKVIMPMKTFARISVVQILTGKIPHNNALVCRGKKN